MAEFSKDALNLLIETSKKTVTASESLMTVVLPDRVTFKVVDTINHSTLSLPLSEPPRSHKLLSIDSVIEWASIYAEKEDNDGDEMKVSVWIGQEKIIVTPENRIDRLLGHRAAYTFQHTPTFELLLSLDPDDDSSAYQQRVFIRLLRTKLWDSFSNPEQRNELLKNVRNVVASQVSNMQSGKGTYETGLQTREGEKIQWPDRLTLMDTVFDEPLFKSKYLIDVTLDVDPVYKTFALWPNKTSLEKAQTEARHFAAVHIREKLKDTPINVYIGSPE